MSSWIILQNFQFGIHAAICRAEQRRRQWEGAGTHMSNEGSYVPQLASETGGRVLAVPTGGAALQILVLPHLHPLSVTNSTNTICFWCWFFPHYSHYRSDHLRLSETLLASEHTAHRQQSHSQRCQVPCSFFTSFPLWGIPCLADWTSMPSVC